MTADTGIAGHVEAPANASPPPPDGSPAPNGGPAEARQQLGEFPIRLSLNITPAMAASLARLKRRMRLKEGVIARVGLMHWLASQDPHYREDD